MNCEISKVVGGSILERENYWIVALWLLNNSSLYILINLN